MNKSYFFQHADLEEDNVPPMTPPGTHVDGMLLDVWHTDNSDNTENPFST